MPFLNIWTTEHCQRVRKWHFLSKWQFSNGLGYGHQSRHQSTIGANGGTNGNFAVISPSTHSIALTPMACTLLIHAFNSLFLASSKWPLLPCKHFGFRSLWMCCRILFSFFGICDHGGREERSFSNRDYKSRPEVGEMAQQLSHVPCHGILAAKQLLDQVIVYY